MKPFLFLSLRAYDITLSFSFSTIETLHIVCIMLTKLKFSKNIMVVVRL